MHTALFSDIIRPRAREVGMRCSSSAVQFPREREGRRFACGIHATWGPPFRRALYIHSHGSLVNGHGEVVQDVRPVCALAVRHPRALDRHRHDGRRSHAAAAAVLAADIAVVVLVLNNMTLYSNSVELRYNCSAHLNRMDMH